MKLNRIRQVALAASDFDESLRFYRDVLGARFIAKFDPPGLAFFDFDGVRLMLERSAAPATLYYWVDDIDAAVAELTARGVVFDQPPHLIFEDGEGTFGPPGEGEWMAFFKDPSGNTVGLATRR
ncbi:MAG: VOC family protein [Proteobacteria bacterium]|jgi:methylmalonyl-CoA/ethylmalonyl-CoA epimerase|nr:VOC family protein [Pseudomonadota bacterium]MDA1301684.1 VOC family protein [Pseudomonadota bacterium]